MLRTWCLFSLLCLAYSLSYAQEVVVVKPGDTLWDLAIRYETSIFAIQKVNGLTGTKLSPGLSLKLPENSNAKPESYTVQTGDTLYDIALAFTLSPDDLIAMNNIEGSVIKPGQVLELAKPEVSSPSSPLQALSITVSAGDTLWSLAQKHGVSLEALQLENNLLNTTIKPGDTLTIPGQYAAKDEVDVDQGGTVSPTITVAKGDTLWHIAKRHNTTVPVLMSANGLSTEAIKEGQTLHIVPEKDLIRATTTEPTNLSSSLVWPLVGTITSRFGYRQLRIGGSNMHNGLDIDGETGDPIVSATSGIVSFSGWRSGYGNVVIIQENNTEYFYAHCSELLVTSGQAVAAGQMIAKVGSTGRSTGSHLHFEIRVDGTPTDPLIMLEKYASSP